MSVLLQSERHRGVTLGTVMQQVVPAFLADQYVLARAVPDRDDAAGTPVGIAFWACVSEAVAARMISSQDGVVRLEPAEWNSGDTVVILDMTPAIGELLVGKIRQKAGADNRIMQLAAAETGGLALRDL
jgi:hemolysin-activating ACP:hemolysin acyltransferase